jgi:hypothetical protein
MAVLMAVEEVATTLTQMQVAAAPVGALAVEAVAGALFSTTVATVAAVPVTNPPTAPKRMAMMVAAVAAAAQVGILPTGVAMIAVMAAVNVQSPPPQTALTHC